MTAGNTVRGIDPAAAVALTGTGQRTGPRRRLRPVRYLGTALRVRIGFRVGWFARQVTG